MRQKTLNWLETYDWYETDYDWGQTDCASLVYWFLWEVLGIQLDNHNYNDLRSALRTYKETGGLETVLPSLGFVKQSLSQAKAGDILVSPLLDNRGFPCYGIVVPQGRYLTSCPEKGILFDSLVNAKGPAYVLRHG